MEIMKRRSFKTFKITFATLAQSAKSYSKRFGHFRQSVDVKKISF